MDFETVAKTMMNLNKDGSVITDEETAHYVIQVLKGLKCSFKTEESSLGVYIEFID